jgi:hypothetical protein
LPKKPSAKKIRRIRAKNAIKGTIAADPVVKITDAPSTTCVYLGAQRSPDGHTMIDPHDIFTEEEIAALKVVYVVDRGRRVHIWRDGKGRWFRTAGYVAIKMRGGERVIQIGLSKGADTQDVAAFEEAVTRLREGRTKHPEWRRSAASWADDRTLQLVFASRRYVDPYEWKPSAPKVEVCTEARCRDQIHEAGDSHTLEVLARSLGRYFQYEIDITKYSHVDDALWLLNINGGTELSEATPEMIASFVNDLNWMAIECDTANKKEQS